MPPRRQVPQPANADATAVVAAPALLPRLEPHEVPVLKNFTSTEYQAWRIEVTDFLQIYNNYQLRPSTLISHKVAAGIAMVWKPANSWAQDAEGDWNNFLEKLDALAHKTLGVNTTLADLKVTKKEGEVQVLEFLSTVAKLDSRSVEPLATKRRHILDALKVVKELAVPRLALVDYFGENPTASVTQAVTDLSDMFITAVAVAREINKGRDFKFGNRSGNRSGFKSGDGGGSKKEDESSSAQERNQRPAFYMSRGSGRGGGRFQGRFDNRQFGRGRGRGGGRTPYNFQDGSQSYQRQQPQRQWQPQFQPLQQPPRGFTQQYQHQTQRPFQQPQQQMYQQPPQPQYQPMYQQPSSSMQLYHAAAPLPVAPTLPSANSRLLHISAGEIDRWREELN